MRPDAISLESRAMAFYKATFVWLLVSVVIGFGIYMTVHPTKPTWFWMAAATLGFIVLVGMTGCKVDDHHEEEGHH